MATNIDNFRKHYPPVDDRASEIKTTIKERLEHIKERVKWSKPSPGFGLYARGFSCGRLHRLIAERYFLELLMEKLAISEGE